MTKGTTAVIGTEDQSPFRTWGFWGVALGAASLILVFIQIFGPMTEPAPSVGAQIGEIAGDMKRAAWKSFFGLKEEAPVEEATSYKMYLALAAPIIGVVAIVLSLISGVLRENWRYALYGTGLGASAILFHFFWWVAILIAAVIILGSIIENLGDFFSFGG